MALLSTYNVGELKMNIALRKERLMEIAEDCFYKYGSYAITVPSFLVEQKFAFQIEKIEQYNHEISCILRKVKRMDPGTECKLGWDTTLGWLRYTEDDAQWCSIYNAVFLCGLGIAAGWLTVTQPKEIFQDNIEITPLRILFERRSIKPSRIK